MVKGKNVSRFWTAFFATLAIVAIGVTVALYFIQSAETEHARQNAVSNDNVYKISAENRYRQALYSVCDSMKNIDANLGKIAVSGSGAGQIKMLTNVTVHANNVTQKLSELPFTQSDNLLAAEKFANQTQDYATYLVGKLADGGSLGVAERAALRSLDATAEGLYNALSAMADDGSLITDGTMADFSGTLDDDMNKMENQLFSYEKLIYDGPFSDSVEKQSVNTPKTISAAEGEKIVAEKLDCQAKFVSEMHADGCFYVYELSGKTEGRVLLTCDGRIAEFDSHAESGSVALYDKEQCMGIAREFAQKLGYDVQPVWVSKTQDFVTYVNLALVENGVVVYPDIVKVAVDATAGKAASLEGRAYLINHKQREISVGDVSEAQAREGLDQSLSVSNANLALVLKDGKEYVCHEFECNADGRQYFVYVDTQTGEEVELFKVIENTEGYTVM